MAASITIVTDLDPFVPVYNPMELVVQADGVLGVSGTLGLTDMKYIFDVYIENVSSPTYFRYEVPPLPTLTTGYVDISRYCEGACNNTMSQNTSTVPISLGSNADGTTSIIKVTVKYGYSYSLAGVYTVVTNVTTGSAKYAWNGSFDYNDWLQLDYNDYICNVTNGADGQFLTDMKTNYVSLNNLGWHHVLTDTPTDIDQVVYKTYDSAGVLIQTAKKAISVSQILTASRMYKIATAPEAINNMTGAWVTGGANPIITSSVYFYTVGLENSANTEASEELVFYVSEPCRYEQRRLHFLNRFGSFDSFNFNLKSTRKRNTERKGYKMEKYAVNGSGINRLHSDKAQVINYNSTQETITLISDFITEEQNTWLLQLIESPEIYLEFTDNAGVQDFKSIESVVGTSWEEKQTENDKLFRCEVEIKLGHKYYRQRR